jgi:hypothetical protein
MSQTTQTDEWTVIDNDHDNRRTADSRQEAEEMAETAREFGSSDVDVIPPGNDTDDNSDESDATEPDVIDVDSVDADPTPADPDVAADLPERSVADDPLTWMPGDFVDEIDGTPAVNRKGFEVLSHFYDISVHADLEAQPEDHDFEYCRVKATATTEDGRECEAYGSAHVDRGDDPELLLEMADTRARKRALSIATGVGAVAVAELKNEVSR